MRGVTGRPCGRLWSDEWRCGHGLNPMRPAGVRVLVVSTSPQVWGAERSLLGLAPLLRQRGIAVTLASPPGALAEAVGGPGPAPRGVRRLPSRLGLRTATDGRPGIRALGARGGHDRPQPRVGWRDWPDMPTSSIRTACGPTWTARWRAGCPATGRAGTPRPRPAGNGPPRAEGGHAAGLEHRRRQPGGGGDTGRTRTARSVSSPRRWMPSGSTPAHRTPRGGPGSAAARTSRSSGSSAVSTRRRASGPWCGRWRCSTGRQERSHLAVVGAPALDDGSYETQLRAEASCLLGDRSRFVGPVEDVPAVLRSLDVLVNASTSEPFGLSVLEAQASGVPVSEPMPAASPSSSPTARPACSWPRGGPDALAAGLSRILGAPGLRDELVAAARDGGRRAPHLRRPGHGPGRCLPHLVHSGSGRVRTLMVTKFLPLPDNNGGTSARWPSPGGWPSSATSCSVATTMAARTARACVTWGSTCGRALAGHAAGSPGASWRRRVFRPGVSGAPLWSRPSAAQPTRNRSTCCRSNISSWSRSC